jgi:hypothetical protein
MIRRAAVVSLIVLAGMHSVASAQVKLEYKFKEGRKSTYQIVSKVQQTLTLNGMNIETGAEEVVSGSTVNGQRAADGTLPITQSVDSIKADIDIAGMTISFDTNDPNAKIEIPQLAFLGEVMKVLAGSKYTVILDKDNKVKDVEGADKILEKAKELDPKVMELLKQRLDLDRIKRQFEKTRGKLPNVLAREGETWETTEEDEIGGGQTLTFRRRYEYNGTTEKNGKSLDKISVKSLSVTYKQEPNEASPLRVVKSDLKIESSKGEILFDREEGVVVERSDVTRMKGTMDFKAGDQDIPGMLDLTLDSSTKSQLGEGSK